MKKNLLEILMVILLPIGLLCLILGYIFTIISKYTLSDNLVANIISMVFKLCEHKKNLLTIKKY